MLRKVSFFCCLCFLFITGPVLAQQKKIIPKKGEVVFTTENIVQDEAQFKASMKETQQKMIKIIKAELELEEGEEIDTTILSQFANKNMMADFLTQPRKKYRHHIYENNFIKSFESNDKGVSHSYSYIDQNKSSYVTRQVLSGDTSETEPSAFEYHQDKDITIKEFRQEKKTINGYNCFKVIYQYKDDFKSGDELAAVFATDEYSTTEFWVTEEIQSLFHPICRLKEILTKYYPLEINEYSPFAKGFVFSHKLKSITLSN